MQVGIQAASGVFSLSLPACGPIGTFNRVVAGTTELHVVRGWDFRYTCSSQSKGRRSPDYCAVAGCLLPVLEGAVFLRRWANPILGTTPRCAGNGPTNPFKLGKQGLQPMSKERVQIRSTAYTSMLVDLEMVGQ